ncbi:MAG: molybdenum cofactor guanylyltransferase [Dehalococcoidia bacterium]|nr:molybdenum cofactor guanylyltransferase [Dehalococcoidia bacterium]
MPGTKSSVASGSERRGPDKRPNGLTGVVLAGGSSSRMGRPKPLVVVGGQLVLARIKAALDRVCDEIVLVVASDQDDATPDTGQALEMHVVTDRLPDAGPLAGIEAGLKAAETPLAFLVAADHPFLSPALIAGMADIAIDGGFDAVVPSQDDRLEPLHAIYAPEAWLPSITPALDAGRRSIYDLINAAIESGSPGVKIMEDAELASYDPEGRSLFDVDTPDSLAQAREMLGITGVVRPDIRPGGL